MTTALFLLRAAQLGIPIRDLELLTIGMVTDMLIEAGNDDCEYSAIKQAAGDAFDERGGASRAGGTAIAYLYLDGVKVGRAVYPYIQGETTRLGTKLVGGRR